MFLINFSTSQHRYLVTIFYISFFVACDPPSVNAPSFRSDMIVQDAQGQNNPTNLSTVDIDMMIDLSDDKTPLHDMLIERDLDLNQMIVVDMFQDQAFTEEVDQTIDLEPCSCFSGVGDYCAQNVLQYAEQTQCLLDSTLNSVNGQELLRCDFTPTSTGEQAIWSILETCSYGCLSGELPSQDFCDLAPCECFVQVSWCGASAGRHGETNLNCRVPLLPEHDNDILACENGEWIVLESCQYGCIEEMTGTPDYCRSSEPNGIETWPDCPDRSLLASGLHPEASNRLRCAGVTASRITQTIGNAAASAGYHAADGTADGLNYTAAVDLRTRDLSNREVRDLLVSLGQHGFAAWYRQPGADGWPSNQAPHIHAIFAGVRMKSQLRGQVRDFLQNKNGLSSHSQYQFWSIPREIKTLIEQLFRRHYTP